MQKEQQNTYKTIMVIMLGFLVAYLVFDLDWILKVVLIIGLVSLLSSKAADLIDRGWMGLAHLLGKIIPNIILALVFYLFLTPIALASRVFTKNDPLHLKRNRSSNWTESKYTFEKSSFEKTW